MNNFRISGLNIFLHMKGKLLYSPISYYHDASFFGQKIDFLSFHTSSERFKFGPAKPPITKYKKPVDWLPFQWHRIPRLNLYEESGDLVKENIIDPSLPKPDFELSDELKTADETIKNVFSVATASKREAQEVLKRNVLKRIQRHPLDFDSLEVRIALMTIRVRALFEHYKTANKKEIRVRRIATPIIIQKRNSLLNQLRKIDEARFKWILEELQLYYNPPTLGEKKEFYCKKWDLRRLTKLYAAKIVADKKAAYHEELKAQQQEFLEEKKQILAWIEEEEKALKSEC